MLPMEADCAIYDVDDIALVACLVVMGIECVDTEWNGAHCIWTYEDCDELRDAIDRYNDRELTVEPRRFYSALTTTKRRMYEERGRRSNRGHRH